MYIYTYDGDLEVHLPTHGITAEANNPTKEYETDEPINHPHFHLKGQQEQPKKHVMHKEETHEEEHITTE